MNKHKVGLVFGSFVACVHIVWTFFVAVGWGQPWLNFILGLHSMNNPYTVMKFDFMRSVYLIVVAFLIAYVFGYFFATLWRKLTR